MVLTIADANLVSRKSVKAKSMIRNGLLSTPRDALRIVLCLIFHYKMKEVNTSSAFLCIQHSLDTVQESVPTLFAHEQGETSMQYT